MQTKEQFLARHMFAVCLGSGQLYTGDRQCCVPVSAGNLRLAHDGFEVATRDELEATDMKFVTGTDLDIVNQETALQLFYYYGRAEQREAILARRHL